VDAEVDADGAFAVNVDADAGALIVAGADADAEVDADGAFSVNVDADADNVYAVYLDASFTGTVDAGADGALSFNVDAGAVADTVFTVNLDAAFTGSVMPLWFAGLGVVHSDAVGLGSGVLSDLYTGSVDANPDVNVGTGSF